LWFWQNRGLFQNAAQRAETGHFDDQTNGGNKYAYGVKERRSPVVTCASKYGVSISNMKKTELKKQFSSILAF
jgi:hypothetical protein